MAENIKEHENFHKVEKEKEKLKAVRRQSLKTPIKSILEAVKRLDIDKKVTKKEKELS